MLTETLKTLFNRDLNKLKSEIESYKNESNLWVIDKEIANSAGNLCLHLIGNLNTYIGATLGNSRYIRNRELEFSLKDIPKQELINMIEATLTVVNQTLDKITELRRMIDDNNLNVLIEVDGGVTIENAGAIIDAGAHALVAGNTVFKSSDPTKTISQLKHIR